jgi:hypothetical protein
MTIGLSIELAQSRGDVPRLDVTFPLDANRSVDRVQWLMTTNDTF